MRTALLKMSKPTKQRATPGDKYTFCFVHLNLRFPLKLRRVCSPFSLLSYGLAPNSGDCCQMGKRLHRTRERPESIRKWQPFSRARGAGQLPGPVAKVTKSSSNQCKRAAVWLDGVGGVTIGILDGMSIFNNDELFYVQITLTLYLLIRSVKVSIREQFMCLKFIIL